jgi:hypothetical protein
LLHTISRSSTTVISLVAATVIKFEKSQKRMLFDDDDVMVEAGSLEHG